MITSHDRTILRGLAGQVALTASLPVMAERRSLWIKHNQLEKTRPMILVFPEGSWRELLPQSVLECSTEITRSWEWSLRARLYAYAHFQDDTLCEGTWVVPKRITVSDWGLQPQHTLRPEETGSWKFIPVIQEFSDFKKLHFPSVSYDPNGTEQDLKTAEDLFGDLLEIQLKGIAHISFHLANLYSDLRGLEQMYLDMVDHPDEMCEALEFFTQGYENLLKQYVEQNLLSLNNDYTYHSSGGVGYANELPAAGFDPERVRPVDLWSSAQSQELAVVSPRMHRKFALDFEKRLLRHFGLNGYGCCEDLTDKLEDVLTIPNIRRISISPFANVDRCAEKLGRKAIFSWKPQPSHLVGEFDPGMVRSYIQHTLDVSKGCVLEMILKDTHTCQNHPERFDEWTKIARELVDAL